MLSPKRPPRFDITLEKHIYLPGDMVRGKINLITTESIECKALRVRLRGESHSYFITGTGEDREERTASKVYVNSQKDIWGYLKKTQVLNSAGANAIFGSPWDPNEGCLHLSLFETQTFIIIRVMDYDWCMKDDLLGECCIDLAQCLGKGTLEAPLLRNGKKEQGNLVFSLNWDHGSASPFDPPEARHLLFKVFRAQNLRSADWCGSNDVYVQAYTIPEGKQVVPGSALPDPPKKASFPVTNGLASFPFEFQLPNNLPSSIVVNGGNHVIYSLYSNFDIAFRRDITTRTFFNVVSPVASALYLQPMAANKEVSLYRKFCCIDLCCFPAIGHLSCEVTLERRAYAPGEYATVSIRYASTTSSAVLAAIVEHRLSITQTAVLHAEGHTRRLSHIMGSISQVPIATGDGEKLHVLRLQVPPLPPSFSGSMVDQDWLQMVRSFGGTRYGLTSPDPLVWSYSLDASICVNQGNCFGPTLHTMAFPLQISSIGLEVLGTVTSATTPIGQVVSMAPASNVASPHTVNAEVVVPMTQRSNERSGSSQVAPMGWPSPTDSIQWTAVPEIVNALPALRASTVAEQQCNSGPTVIKHSIEDFDIQDKTTLHYTPSYFVSSPTDATDVAVPTDNAKTEDHVYSAF